MALDDEATPAYLNSKCYDSFYFQANYEICSNNEEAPDRPNSIRTSLELELERMKDHPNSKCSDPIYFQANYEICSDEVVPWSPTPPPKDLWSPTPPPPTPEPEIVLPKVTATPKVTKQTEKAKTIIIPTGSLGEISEVRKKMLEKTLESKLDDYFDIVPRELFEEAQEQAFQEMESDECTEEKCIAMIQEILQVPNAFQLILMIEDGDTQISLTWNDMQRKKVEENYCEGCKTKELRNMIDEMVGKLLGK